MDISWFYFDFKGKIILTSNYILMNLYLYSKITFELMCTYITFCICHQYNKSFCFIVTFF